MRTTLKALKKKRVDRLVIESVELSLYIAIAEIDGERHLISDDRGQALRTTNLLAMKTLLMGVDARERVLSQRSAYDEMVGQGFEAGDNRMEIPLGPGFETLPSWQH
jgi:hypothetical protein